MELILESFFLLFATTQVSHAASTCYFPDGISSTNFTPCMNDDSSFSACCAVGDECFTNGLCKSTGMGSSTAFWRNLCTDATWQSDACPKYCYNESTSHEASAQSNFVLACSNTTYCCAEQILALSSGSYSYCCGDKEALFTAAPPVHLSGLQNPLPLFASTASASVSTSVLSSSLSSATTGTSSGTVSSGAASTEGSTVQPVNNNGSSLSTGAKAGIGAGVAAAVIIIAIVLFMIRRSKAKGSKEELNKVPGELSTEKWRDYDGPQREQEMGEFSNSQTPVEKEAKSKIPDLSNVGARFELGEARGPVELDERVR